MQYAKYINTLAEFDKIDNKYTMVYIGNDFCDRIHWEFTDILKIYKKAEKASMKVGIKTPFITETNVGYYQKLIKQINDAQLEVEIVLNDFGLLYYINANGYCKSCSLTLGRLLCRQKTDRMTAKLKGRIAEEVYKHFTTPVAISNAYKKIIEQYRISRFELENVEFDWNLPEVDFEYKVTIVTPYVSVGTTRLCPYVQSSEEKLHIKECNFECFDKKLYVNDENVGEYVYINNTIAYKNSEMNDNAKLPVVDRVLDESWR